MSYCIAAKVVPVKAEQIQIRKSDKSTCSIATYGTDVAPDLSKEENYQRALKLIYDIRNANRTLVPPVVNIVDLSKFRTHDLPTVQTLSSLPDRCLELDHELAYSNVMEVETTPLSIVSFPHLTFDHSAVDGFDDECQRLMSQISIISAVDRQRIELITRGQSKNQEWFIQRAGLYLLLIYSNK